MSLRHTLTILALGLSTTACATFSASSSHITIAIGPVEAACDPPSKHQCLALQVQNSGKPVQFPIWPVHAGAMIGEPHYEFEKRRRDQPETEWKPMVLSVGSYEESGEFLTVGTSETKALLVPLPHFTEREADLVFRIRVWDRRGREYVSAPFDSAGSPWPSASALVDTPEIADSIPKGHGSAEGAVADLARAFINGDAKLFRETAARPFGGGDTRKEYEEYLASTESKLGKSAKTDRPSKIVKVYAARHLSKGAPASYGYATFGFKDVMFVDVMVGSTGGEESVLRVLAVQEASGEWHALPAHWLWPLLSDGLAEESKPEQPASDQVQQ